MQKLGQVLWGLALLKKTHSTTWHLSLQSLELDSQDVLQHGIFKPLRGVCDSRGESLRKFMLAFVSPTAYQALMSLHEFPQVKGHVVLGGPAGSAISPQYGLGVLDDGLVKRL